MYTYDNPFRETITFSQVDFGAVANLTTALSVPVLRNGRKPGGRVVGARIHRVTEDFAGSSADGLVQVGVAGDLDKYFRSIALDETVDIGEGLWLSNVANDAVNIENGRTDVTVTFVASTGTPAGIADVSLVIDWF